MTNNEKIQRAEQLIAEANTLLGEVKANSSNEEDVIAKYKEDYCKDKQYYFNVNGDVDFFVPTELDAFEKQSNPYSNYLTEELAEQAKKLKDFNDKLLAFKYCYDLDYKPDWSDSHEDKYYVYYSNRTPKYDVDSMTIWDIHNVYFSSEEIAQKCADWLNSLGE
jgi:hypothetical protein